jgi:glycosyltransferase involved in cell wall biosynthesis
MGEILQNRVGVVVVNLNQLQLTKKCISDLLNQKNKNFEIYLYDQNSHEEGTLEFLKECENNNVITFRNNENVPLNYIWNNFKNICDCEYLCFLNNDIELSNMFIDDTMNILKSQPLVGFVIHVTNHPKYLTTTKNLNYKILNPAYYQGWDFTLRRSVIPEIPKELIIFGGDDYIFARGVNEGWKVALVYSSPIIHYSSKTRESVSNIAEIQANDAKHFYRILAEEKLQQINITTNVGLCERAPQPNMKIINI